MPPKDETRNGSNSGGARRPEAHRSRIGWSNGGEPRSLSSADCGPTAPSSRSERARRCVRPILPSPVDRSVAMTRAVRHAWAGVRARTSVSESRLAVRRCSVGAASVVRRRCVVTTPGARRRASLAVSGPRKRHPARLFSLNRFSPERKRQRDAPPAAIGRRPNGRRALAFAHRVRRGRRGHPPGGTRLHSRGNAPLRATVA